MGQSSKVPIGVDLTSAAKALAICLVVLTHADWAEADRLCPVFPFVVNAAVPLFMMVTGLNYARSYRRKGAATLAEMYDPSTLLRRIRALVLPFVPAFLLEVPLAALRNHLGFSTIDLSPAGLALGFASGGWGPGGYYLPVMIQVVLAYPLLCLLVRRFGWGAFTAVAAGCLTVDLFQSAIGLPLGVWRVLCVRYLPYLAVGALLESRELEGLRNGGYQRRVFLTLLAIGGGYLSCLTYGPLASSLSAIQTEWASTSIPSGLFFIGAFGLLHTQFGEVKPRGHGWAAVGMVARNTWFIFLVQSVWYFAGANAVFDFLPVPVAATVFLCICVTLGCIYGTLWKRRRFFNRSITDHYVKSK